MTGDIFAETVGLVTEGPTPTIERLAYFCAGRLIHGDLATKNISAALSFSSLGNEPVAVNADVLAAVARAARKARYVSLQLADNTLIIELHYETERTCRFRLPLAAERNADTRLLALFTPPTTPNTTIDTMTLHHAIQNVIFALPTAPEASRNTRFLCWRYDGASGEHTMAATDSHRLSETRLYDRVSPDGSFTVLLPRHSAADIARLAKAAANASISDAAIYYEEEEPRLLIDFGGRFQFAAQFAELRGKYIDYEKHLPSSADFVLSFSCAVAELRASLRRIAVIAQENVNRADFVFVPPSELRISAQALLDALRGTETLFVTPLSPAPQEFSISLNWRYISEYLEACCGDTPEVVIELVSPERATLWRAANHNTRYYLMPMRT